MLVTHRRQSLEDLRHWREMELLDSRLAGTRRLEMRVRAAIEAIRQFSYGGSCYAGVSWGKDSVVLARLIVLSGVKIPLVWIRVEPKKNPDCLLVRDAFLAAHSGVGYSEIESLCAWHPGVGWRATGTLERGFAQAEKSFGDRHLSGIRADESAQRELRMARYGVASARTCAPIGYWSAAEVFAFLFRERLPVHPAYACTMGGRLDRSRLRVASLEGARGTGHGRAEWESHYYREDLARLHDTPV